MADREKMIQTIKNFKTKEFYEASKELFHTLAIPMNEITHLPIGINEIFEEEKDFFKYIENIYTLGMIDDEMFQNKENNFNIANKKDYEGILIFLVELNSIPNRTTLSNITRAFNREYHYTPVVVIFKYDNFISLANTQRVEYKQSWREGEKIAKVTILRDIDTNNPHRGHIDILLKMKISNKIKNYDELYKHWQEVFDVSLLNKQFYQELSNWYSYAINEVTFPSQPQKGSSDEEVIAHKSKNVIRLLTRFLFVWFIKEKGLIPEELFDEEYIKKTLKEFNPKNLDGTLFNGQDKSSIYYKAILQNLFFASLNCPIEPLDKFDTRKRGFRKNDHYGQHRDANFLMRYEKSFNNPQEFLELINKYVPFLNGGLFECLDDKTNNTYIDGFSDNLPKPHHLIVPDYLFFGIEKHIDLSAWYGSKKKTFKDATVKGLINILKSYKFTITENTPIEEDVALDPELLGRVFENLLASYNPETKTTARKQTGSFYTPREIVSYMVDESIIAYLKTKLEDNFNYENLEDDLRTLCSYSDIQPFTDKNIIEKIINSLDKLKALDPAVGSGAFPMGMLQKMVHILTKLDPENSYWYELQLDKAQNESNEAFKNQDKEEREKLLIEINNIFDETINNPDYARKLYIIENSIYGVDIQPIAIQISKLRFFISLVIEQKIDKTKPNFGIRPLPNLETKFIAANTLIGIEKNKNSLIDFDETIKQLEKKLKNIRHRLFNAKTPKTKRTLREKDKELREKISTELLKSGWNKDTAEKLAQWDPYDQNSSSSFFDIEWMFGIKDGFDIVIGNPPYIKEYTDKNIFKSLKHLECYEGKMDLWYLFGCKAIDFLKHKGHTSFIATNNWTTNEGASKFRNKVLKNTIIKQFLDFRDFMIFETASIQTMIYLLQKDIKDKYIVDFRQINKDKSTKKEAYELMKKIGNHIYLDIEFIPKKFIDKKITFISDKNEAILDKIASQRNFILDKNTEVAQGIVAPQDFLNQKGVEKLHYTIPKGSGIFNLTNKELNSLNLDDNELKLIKPFYNSEQLNRYYGNPKNKLWVIYTDSSFKNPKSMDKYPNLKKHLDKFQKVITSDNKPYGLHRARKEKFFIGEKIIIQRKCPKRPVFTFTDFDCYVSQTYFVIKTSRINQKYLVALLNSKLIEFWLRHKGKMQGNNYQIDKSPILEIPIKQINDTKPFEILVDYIIFLKSQKEDINPYISNDNLVKLYFEEVLDAMVFELYFEKEFKEKNIEFIKYASKYFKSIENLDDNKKIEVILNSYEILTKRTNEIKDNLELMKIRLKDLLEPILKV